MKNIFIILILLLLANTVLKSNVITVDNKNPGMGQFNSLQAAHDAANSGDIIYLYPSPVPYSAITVSKQITITGNGFETIEPSFYSSALIGELIITANFVKITSLDGGFPIIIDANNVIIQRCRLCNISINPDHRDNKIIQNTLNASSSYESCISIDSNSGFLISNNIIESGSTSKNGVSGYPCCIFIKNSYGIIRFNYISSYPFQTQSSIYGTIVSGYGFLIENCTSLLIQYNLLYQGHISGSSHFYKNNISSNVQHLNIYYLGWEWHRESQDVDMFSTSENTNKIDFSTIFLNGYHIIPGSIASSEGAYKTQLLFDNAKEVGIYGGDTPFVDGGYPDIPVIYQFEAASIATRLNGVKVKIKAKSNK